MFGPFERAVAGRYLRARRGERFVSVIAGFSLVGFAIGVAALIIVMSVMGGFKADLLGRILGFDGHLAVFPDGGPIADYAADATRIRTVPGVTSAIPVVDGLVLLSDDHGHNTGGQVRGIAQADLESLHAISDNIRGGSLADFHGNDAVAIGVNLARSLGLSVGSKLNVLSPQGAATAIGTIPRVRAYTVVAVFQVGMFPYDNTYAFLPLEAAQVFFQLPGQATQIEVRVDDPERARPVGQAILQALADAQVRIVDWQQSNNSYFAAITVEQNVMFLILMLIVLVAAFNVISTLIMMVKDKSQDIAVMRTIGAGRGAILRVFLMVGTAIGVAGTAVGSVIGIVFCTFIEDIQRFVERVTGQTVFDPTVYYLTHLPARLNRGEVTQIIVVSLLLSLLATIIPSWRAARTDPVEALRNG